jgi:hypothetical protein
MVMLFHSKSGKIGRSPLAASALLALGTSALMFGATATPAMATAIPAAAANCSNSGSGAASYINGALFWKQVWSKHTRNCTDFYQTSQTTQDSYAGFYKSPSASGWQEAASGYHALNRGSDGNQGVDLVTNLAVNTQLTTVGFNETSSFSEGVGVKF